MTEPIPHHDKYLDPPTIPEYALCAKCGNKLHADDLDDDGPCDECLQSQEEQERE